MILNLAVASEAVPLVATLAVRGRHPPAAYRRLAIWCCVLLLSDVLSDVVAALYGYNLWINYFSEPIESAITLWILMSWQVSDAWVWTYRLGMPILLALVAALLLLTDPTYSFANWIGPGIAIITLAGSLQTLIQRTLLSREILTTQDWFWVCLGITVFWACYVPVAPFAMAMIASHQDWVRMAYLVRAVVMMGSFFVMTWGVLCIQPQIPSPGLS